MDAILNDDRDTSVLEQFNRRDTWAFAEVYSSFFVELHAYTLRLYGKTDIVPEDIVQDAFIYLWEQKKITFETIAKIKSFLFVLIKHKFYNYRNHQGVVRKYEKAAEYENHSSDELFNSELFTSLMEHVERIPGVGGQVLKLYLNGYEAEDIAEKMQMNVQSVYNAKSMTIKRLKKLIASRE